MRNVTQRFGAFRALKNVDFDVHHGETVALLGENGCGKSTLVKILAGINVPDPESELYLDGRPHALPLPPGEFRDLGLSFVHQDLGLSRTLTVVENLTIGGLGSTRRRINWRRERSRAREVLRSYNVDVDPSATIDQLPPVAQALVAIVRAAEDLKLYRERGDLGHSVLFLDEPTVFLPDTEVEFLFDLVRSVVAGGASTVFISHDLSAVRRLCQRAAVLRDGELVGEAQLGQVSDNDLVEMIVGPAKQTLVGRSQRRTLADDVSRRPVACEISDLRGGRVYGVTLSIHETEVVGIAGLLGSGADDIPYLLFGAQRAESGTMSLNGHAHPIAGMTTVDAVYRQVALVPADRRRDAIVAPLTVGENASILVNDRYTTAGRRIQGRRLNARIRQLLDRFDVRPRRSDVPIGQLSGGNQQKVVLAKWLEIEPRVLLLHEPTQGVDVAARAEIYRLVREGTEAGMGVIWVSSDFEELARVCDRVLIMAHGLVRSELTGNDVTEDAISTAVYRYSTDEGAMLAHAS
ncbi:MAG: sugar ABC transporter ATP-binding protein [Solirubrobacterales bacterium]|nr:sugar ABC transporter ATP-binding protein [Solirubrobacterales bacterium]MBV9715977.1 sugar ABC transporter ATP-binding protein [Solirubrobacterales bacterium]